RIYEAEFERVHALQEPRAQRRVRTHQFRNLTYVDRFVREQTQQPGGDWRKWRNLAQVRQNSSLRHTYSRHAYRLIRGNSVAPQTRVWRPCEPRHRPASRAAAVPPARSRDKV